MTCKPAESSRHREAKRPPRRHSKTSGLTNNGPNLSAKGMTRVPQSGEVAACASGFAARGHSMDVGPPCGCGKLGLRRSVRTGGAISSSLCHTGSCTRLTVAVPVPAAFHGADHAPGCAPLRLIRPDPGGARCEGCVIRPKAGRLDPSVSRSDVCVAAPLGIVTTPGWWPNHQTPCPVRNSAHSRCGSGPTRPDVCLRRANPTSDRHLV